MTIEELEKKLKQGNLDSLYLLYGEETFLLESCLKKIKNLFGEIIKGINYVEIYDTNLDSLIQEIETPAFGYEKKLVIIKNVGLLKKEVKKKGADFVNIRDKFIEYLESNKVTIKDTVILVFIEESIDKTKLLSVIEGLNACICNFEYQKLPNIMARLKAISKAYGVKISDTNLKYFIEGVGTNMQDLINELRKQIEYAGEGNEITKESIDLLATKQMESVIFDLTDNLGKKNIKQARIVLNNLLYSKEPIQKILITLYNHFKKLYITKLSVEQNRNIAECIDLKPNQMFLVNKYKAQSEYFTKIELKEILEKLIELDTNYKVGKIDLDVGLEAILCVYCSK